MGKNKTFTVRYERGRDGWWTATVKELDGCITQGRSIAQARERIREAMSLEVPATVAEKAHLDEEIQVLGLEDELRAVREERAEAERLAERVTEKTKGLATRLAKAGVSRRDVGELLGISFQRVQQIAK